jgi:predicted nucleotidyltransferase
MRIDPHSKIAGQPALLVRDWLRKLRTRMCWEMAEFETVASINPGNGRSIVRALSKAGLVERVGRGTWEITQAGQTLSSATGARPISRSTAEKAVREFLERVEQVNQDDRFLGRINRVVLFGSILRDDVDRLSDLDLAVEVVVKTADRERHAVENQRQVEALVRAGHVFRNAFDMQLYWYREVFRILKSRGRIISLADYRAEKSFILKVPHRMLLGEEEQLPAEPPPEAQPRLKPSRRPRGCPF